MGKYFGTDGFRGKAGEVLTASHAFSIGQFIGWYFTKKHDEEYIKRCDEAKAKGLEMPVRTNAKVVIGKDTRRSSYMYENALASGLTSQGADCYLLHVTTTPCVGYITRTEQFDLGVMISASHNPFYDNGIKLMNEEGEKMEDEFLDKIEAFIDGKGPELPMVTGDRIGKTVDFYNGRNRYIGYLTSIATHSFENTRVGLDCANGSAWMIAKAVFDALGAKTYVINNEPDGTNINLKCGSTHIEGLCKYVKENRLDVGFAFDGDADRCLMVDENGNEVNGDIMMFIAAKYLKANGMLHSNTVVTTIMSNFGLYKALDQAGIGYEKTAVGDRYVYENMKAYGHELGGEQSGHIIFRKYAHTGDGLVTAINLMNILVETQLPLSVHASQVKMYPQILKNVEVDDKDATLSDKEVVKACDDATKELGANGRILLRKSGTEPVLRVMAEALTLEECEAKVDAIIDSMRQSGHLLKIR